VDERDRGREALRRRVRGAARPRFEAFAAEPPLTRMGLFRAGIEPAVIRRRRPRDGAPRPATLVHPGRHATWYATTHSERAIALINALLGAGAQGRLLRPRQHGRPGYRTHPIRKSRRARSIIGPEYPSRARRSRRASGGNADRKAVPDQGVARLRDEPDSCPAQRGRDDRGHPEARPAGRGGRDRQ